MAGKDTFELLIQAFSAQGVLPLFYHDDAEVCISATESLYQAGVRAIEFTNRGREAFNNAAALIAWRNDHANDMLVGIGTIKLVADAKAYVDLGADFLISPGFVPAVADYCREVNIPYAPGCMTPSEIIEAENKGVRLIKLFPGNSLGPEFLKAIKPVFPDLYFMPTGGVEPEEGNLRSWFEAGVCAVGMGSKLIPNSLLQKGDYQKLTADTVSVMALVHSIKNP